MAPFRFFLDFFLLILAALVLGVGVRARTSFEAEAGCRGGRRGAAAEAGVGFLRPRLLTAVVVEAGGIDI